MQQYTKLICRHHINYDSVMTTNEQSMCRKGSRYIIEFVCGAFNTLQAFGVRICLLLCKIILFNNAIV